MKKIFFAFLALMISGLFLTSPIRANETITPKKTKELYQFFDRYNSSRRFVTSQSKADSLIANSTRFDYEGTSEYKIIPYNKELRKCVGVSTELKAYFPKVHVFKHNYSKSNVYISDRRTVKSLKNNTNFKHLGVDFCGATPEVTGSIPVYVFIGINEMGGYMFYYTHNEVEKNDLINNSKVWQYTGIAFYGII